MTTLQTLRLLELDPKHRKGTQAVLLRGFHLRDRTPKYTTCEEPFCFRCDRAGQEEMERG